MASKVEPYRFARSPNTAVRLVPCHRASCGKPTRGACPSGWRRPHTLADMDHTVPLCPNACTATAALRAATTKMISRCGRSMIAATAIDHIGAKPVPLATRTRLPVWFGRRKALPNGPVSLDAVPDADIPAQRGGYRAVGKLSDVKVQHAVVGAALQRIGRAVASRRKTPKLQLAILAGKVAKRFRQLDVDTDDVGGETNDAGHLG